MSRLCNHRHHLENGELGSPRSHELGMAVVCEHAHLHETFLSTAYQVLVAVFAEQTGEEPEPHETDR